MRLRERCENTGRAVTGARAESGWELQQAVTKSLNRGCEGVAGKKVERYEREPAGGRSLQREKGVEGRGAAGVCAGQRDFECGRPSIERSKGRTGRGKRWTRAGWQRKRAGKPVEQGSDEVEHGARSRDWQRERVERGAESRRSRRDDGRGGQLGAMTGKRPGLFLETGAW